MSSRLAAHEMLDLVVDQGSFSSWDIAPDRTDASPDYLAELQRASEESGCDESVITGEGAIDGVQVALMVGEFAFLAGSVGRAAAERIVTAIKRATHEGLPLIGMPISGGTRMQEGTPAFVQMAPIAAAIAEHKAAGLPYVVYLRNPTTGGVMATWGSLGSVTAAEPHALLGFLGPRVYEAIYGEPFPAGVQTADNLLRLGIIDAVVPHGELRGWLRTALGLDTPPSAALDQPTTAEPFARHASRGPQGNVEPVDAWEAIERSRNPLRPGVRELLAAAESAEILALSEDRSVVVARCSFQGQRCIVAGQDGAAQRERPLGPAGLREARRAMRRAVDEELPLVTVIDTPGAELSQAAEEGDIVGEIARSLADLTTLPVPTVSLVMGQGCGGGALALFPADRIVSAQNGWLAPLPPEGASAIVHRTVDRAPEMARAQRVGATELANLGLIDVIVPERPDAAEESEAFCARVAEHLAQELLALRQRTAPTAERLGRY